MDTQVEANKLIARRFVEEVLGADQSAPRAAGRSMRIEVHHLHGEGDLVGGKTVEWSAMALLRFEDNRIAEEWVVRDELHVALQAGAVTRTSSNPGDC